MRELRYQRGLLGAIIFACTLACGPQSEVKEDKKKAESAAPEQASSSINVDKAVVGEAGVDYPVAYCANVAKIKVRTDIKPELDLLCRDGKPTALMLQYREKALKQAPGVIEVNFLTQKSTEASDRSEFVLIWAFHVPIRPFVVKGRPIYDYIAKGYKSADVDFAVKANLQKDAVPDSGLHLWTTEMDYALSVKPLPSLTLANDRKTQYNLYQLVSGNEEMGLGVEHLIASPDETYAVSNLVNFSFNDGAGYNDGKGGAIVVNLLRFDFNNRGFPETAVTTIMSVAQALANNMYDGLKQ